MQCKVLVQKTYIVGHYVTVDAKSANDAQEQVRQALSGDAESGRCQDLYSRIENIFENIESEIDEWFKDGDSILNAPPVGGSSNVAGIVLASTEGWSRPLVIEEKPLFIRKGESQ